MIRFALGAALLSVAVPALAQTTIIEPPVIVTQGEAILHRVPDRAWIQVTAEARGAKPADAQAKSAQAMTTVQDAMKKLGLPPDAVRTTSYSLQPDMVYANGQSTVKGYVVRNQIEIRVDDLAKFGEIIDASGAAGATAMSGLRYDVKDRVNLEREALRLAVQDAMDRARAIAAGAGKSLGEIQRIQEQRISEAVPMYRMAASAGAAAMRPETPVASGEIEIRGQVMLNVGIR